MEYQGILILMVTVWIFGKVFRSLKLPVIFGEIIGGILLGPMVFGLIEPDNQTLKILADLGIFFLILHAGLETDPKELVHASKKAFFVSIGTISLPFVSGILLGGAFGLDMTSSLFLGLAMSCSAISITFRLFKELKLPRTPLVNIAISTAIIDDVLVLILFSVVYSFVETGSFILIDTVFLIVKIVFFFVSVLYIGDKTAKTFGKQLSDKGFSFTLIVALSLGLIAEAIGLHIIIGAFLAGLFVREEVTEKHKFHKIEDRIYGLSYSFLGPIFFATLAVDLTFDSIFVTPYLLISVIVVATLSKVLGGAIGALSQKFSLKKSLTLGMSVNSRGTVQLIIATIAYESGFITQNLFSVLIFLAFVTTFITIFGVKSIKNIFLESKDNSFNSAKTN